MMCRAMRWASARKKREQFTSWDRWVRGQRAALERSPMYSAQAGGRVALIFHGERDRRQPSGVPARRHESSSRKRFMPMSYRGCDRTLQLRAFQLRAVHFSEARLAAAFQTGDLQGEPIIDRRTPHDLFMELAAQTTIPSAARTCTPRGFPVNRAVPVASMHRASARESTARLRITCKIDVHTFRVLTSGFTYRWLEVEVSVFKRPEPDDNVTASSSIRGTRARACHRAPTKTVRCSGATAF